MSLDSLLARLEKGTFDDDGTEKKLQDNKAHPTTPILVYVAESKREERRKKVLAMLANKPDSQRAIITDLDSDPDNVILTIAIRDVATFEMLISREKYDPFLLLNLLRSQETVEH